MFVLSVSSLLPFYSSQIVPTVRKVEAFVAKREVRNLLVAERQRQTAPIVKGRIHDLVPGKLPVGVRQGYLADLSAPAFDEGHGDVLRLQRPNVAANGSAGECLQLAADKGNRPLDLQPPYEGPGEDVARRPRGNRNLSKPENAGREI